MIHGQPPENVHSSVAVALHFEEPQVDVQHLKNRPFPIVGLGGSAGAFESFKEFFESIPPDSGMAFVLVQHLYPSVKSMLPELLQRSSAVKVIQVTDGVVVEPDCLFVIPENTEMVIFNGKLLLFKPARPRGLRMPIDTFFQSLAADWGEKAVGIVFSGMGSDGELGARFIKKALGLIIAQDPQTALFPSMPRSVIDTAIVDFVLAPADMPAKLLPFVNQPYQNMQKKNAFTSPKVANALQKVLQLLRSHTGHDFSLYKPNTVFRRLERRLHTHQLKDMEEYIQLLQDNPEELNILFKDLLIGVTKFFRDYQAFEVLEEKLLPELFRNKSKNEPFRVWVAGCSTGEEAYSIAILIREYIEKSEVKHPIKIQLYATDLDSNAIDRARKGLYYSNMAADISPERLQRWFTNQGNMYQISQQIREMVVFAEHNLVNDPAFTKLDLLCCRNVFIYFRQELQKKLLPVFHFSLNPSGVLFLGPSENIHESEHLFETLDVKWKFYKRRQNDSALPGLIEFPGRPATHHPLKTLPANEKAPVSLGLGEAVKKVLLKEHTPPAVLINDKGDLLYINGRTTPYLELMPGNLELNIFSMAIERLSFELHGAVKQAVDRQENVAVNNLKLKPDNRQLMLNIRVKYLKAPEEVKGLLLVTFEEQPLPTKRPRSFSSDSTVSRQMLEEKEEEARILREQLQQTREEKDVTVEEIRSTNEELQSTNEELQSTNEEAISAREELQSMNEELMTVNTELKEKTDQLIEMNNDMVNLLNSSTIATIFVDIELKIRRFTPAASEIIHLIYSDVGRPLSHIRSSLQYDGMIEDIRSVVNRLVPKQTEVPSKEGKYFSVRILPYRTVDNFIDGAVITFIDITSMKESQKKQEEGFRLMENIVDSVRDPMLVLDRQQRIVAISRAFRETFKVQEEHTRGKLLYDLGNAQWNIEKLKQLLGKIVQEGRQEDFKDFIVEHHFPSIGFKRMKLHARHLIDKQGQNQDHLILLTIEDITG